MKNKEIKKNNNVTHVLNNLCVKFDILAVTENWLDKSDVELYDIDEFQVTHVVRDSKKGGGVSLYIRNSIKFNVVKNLCFYVIHKRTKVCKNKRTLSCENLCKLNTCLEQCDWSSVIQCNDVDEAYVKFINLYKLKLNSCCPVKKYIVKDVQKQKPWITKGLENACKKKNNLYKNFFEKSINCLFKEV